MIATGYEKYGSQGALEKDAIKHLFDVYVKVSKDAELDPEVKVEAADSLLFREFAKFESGSSGWKMVMKTRCRTGGCGGR